MDYGMRIYELRKQKLLSQEEVANDLGVSRQSISLWETNQASPSMENLISIAKLFDISLDDLVGISTPNKEEIQIEDKPIFIVDYKEDKYAVYRRDYMYLSSKADAVMFSLSLFFFIFALSSFISALNMETQVAKIALIIGYISLIIGIIIYPLYMYINILKKTENHNKIHIEFYNDYLIYDCSNRSKDTIQYEMIDYFIAKKDYLLVFLFKNKRLYIPKNSVNGLDEFFSKRADKRKNKKPFWA